MWSGAQAELPRSGVKASAPVPSTPGGVHVARCMPRSVAGGVGHTRAPAGSKRGSASNASLQRKQAPSQRPHHAKRAVWRPRTCSMGETKTLRVECAVGAIHGMQCWGLYGGWRHAHTPPRRSRHNNRRYVATNRRLTRLGTPLNSVRGFGLDKASAGLRSPHVLKLRAASGELLPVTTRHEPLCADPALCPCGRQRPWLPNCRPTPGSSAWRRRGFTPQGPHASRRNSRPRLYGWRRSSASSSTS